MSARMTATLPDEMRIDSGSLNQLFVQARTHNKWLDRPIAEALLRELYDLTRLAPTSANSQPMRVVFVQSLEANERLKPALAPKNVEKTMTAPVTAITASCSNSSLGPLNVASSTAALSSLPTSRFANRNEAPAAVNSARYATIVVGLVMRL